MPPKLELSVLTAYAHCRADMENVSDEQTKPIRLLQITDSHLGGDSSETLLGLNTEQSLRDVLEHLRDSDETFDLIVATGDISNDGSFQSYDRFVQLVNEYLPGMPLAWLDGNHDDPVGMADITVKRPIEFEYTLPGWQFIMLSSRIPFEEGGDLCNDELVRLERFLSANPDTPTMIFLHHQVVPVGCEWIDRYVVNSADKFFHIIDQYPSVKTVCWGHVHQSFVQKRKGVSLMAAPSTCIQFQPKSQRFAVDSRMPGYRCFELYQDGSFTSDVHRVSERDYSIDFDSPGY